MAEQRYKAVLAVISDGRSITEVAASSGVFRRTLHTWLGRWERAGLEGLVDLSHRPVSCPHQLDGRVEVEVLEARRAHPGWGARRIAYELGRRGVVVSESSAYRALRRAGLIDPDRRRSCASVTRVRRKLWEDAQVIGRPSSPTAASSSRRTRFVTKENSRGDSRSSGFGKT